MNKSMIVIVVSVVATVLMLLLLGSIQGNKADQAMINVVPNIKKLEPRSAEWGKYYPRQYDSYIATKESDKIDDVLKKDPNLVVLWAGYAFSKDYNAPRGHFYMLEDNINTLRTADPVDDKTGPMPTACWTCKSPDVPRLMAEKGELEFFTGKWSRLGAEIVNPVGCADCHDNETMRLSVKRDFLARALDAEGSAPFAKATHQDMRTLVCAQCHVEYYFKKTDWQDADGKDQTAMVVTLPWNNGLSVEAIEQYYDERKFSDWTHQLSKAPMLKAQHPGYETFKTGMHGQNNLGCADCHMPYVREGGVKYSDHKIGSPLDNIRNTCLNCHGESEEEFKQIVKRKLERKDELAFAATDAIAKAHFEAAKAWELGASEDEMTPALMDIRHAQWRWDFAVASHGGFFHAPEETLRILATAIDKGYAARLKLRDILAKYGAPGFEGPAFSNKAEAQELIGLQMDKLVDEKITFLNTLRKEWIQKASHSGKDIYDPKTEVKTFKTSYNAEK
ncbi:MAG: ammonia-forming cytochrome c nitrite reductase [Desulfuromonadaceae bacterium]|nr:ammonia-forming cytochrome c nitrite reductase [Desulfuromonas sp.]MDY0186060.1 ammonia-forming cytochrome c nitrite reductase [Desulfuromonadaceae bacterium]